MIFPRWYLVFRYLLRLCCISTVTNYQLCFEYEGCLESTHPFWISQEPVVWPWCNLAASQRRPYCASVNSHCPIGLVSRQWDAAELVYCVTVAFTNLLPFNSDFSFRKKTDVAGSQIWAVGVLTDLGDALFYQKSLHESCRMCRRVVVMKLICSLGCCECDGHTVRKLSQRRLTADWLAPREGNCWQMRKEVSSDWSPSYIKATRPSSWDIQNGWILSGQASYLALSPDTIGFLHYAVKRNCTGQYCSPFHTMTCTNTFLAL